MPSPAEISKAYKNYYTHKKSTQTNNLFRRVYSFVRTGYLTRRYHFHLAISPWQRLAGFLLYLHPVYRATADVMVFRAHYRPGGRLLDVGCGSGEILSILTSLGWRGEGVDVDEAAVAQARARGLTVHLGTLEEQHYADNHFDVITLNHVVEHIHDPISLFKECYRILKQGGQLIVVTPNIDSLGHRIFADSWRGLEPPRHLYLYSAKSLGVALQQTSFTIESIYYTARSARSIALESRVMRREIGTINDAPPSTRDRLYSGWFFWYEWALLTYKPHLGEEIFLKAQKAR